MFSTVRGVVSRLTSTSTVRKMSQYIPKDRLAGKVAVVTASTAGIGYATARRLGLEGAKVVICSRKEKSVEDAISALKKEGIAVTGVACHVAKAEDRKKLFKEAIDKFGAIDILVSNAGINPVMGPIFDTDEKSWDKTFEVNVKASFLCAKEALPFIRKQNGGSIIFMSSIGGIQPFNLLGTYSVTKTALLGLVKAGAADLASENITVNGVCPGVIKTAFSAPLHGGPAAEISLSQIPIGRFGTPDEVAGLVAYLVSEDGRYVTGENFVIAGGMQSRL